MVETKETNVNIVGINDMVEIPNRNLELQDSKMVKMDVVGSIDLIDDVVVQDWLEEKPKKDDLEDEDALDEDVENEEVEKVENVYVVGKPEMDMVLLHAIMVLEQPVAQMIDVD